MKEIREHIHYTLYSLIIVVAVVMHGDRPIDSAGSKLTILLMGLLILGESAMRVLAARRKQGSGENGG